MSKRFIHAGNRIVADQAHGHIGALEFELLAYTS
jgi:hypothetical protein